MTSKRASRNKAQAKYAAKVRRAQVCAACGKRGDQFQCGRWCWNCYCELIDWVPRGPKWTDQGREERIKYYQERARNRLPLFQ